MRTSIEIDDRLLREAMRASGRKTKRSVIEAALQLLVQTASQTGVRRLRGRLNWQGDLELSRADRVPDTGSR